MVILMDGFGNYYNDPVSPEDRKSQESKKATAFFNAVVKAGKVNELDSTVLEFCEGDYDKAAKMLGLSLDI